MFSSIFKRYFTTTTMVSAETTKKVQDLIKAKPVFIASKSYCPYCTKTKNLIGSITKDAYILELDTIEDGGEIQEALLQLTGQRTVPNVFIGGEHIGGNSDVQALNSADKLEPKIKALL
ncbi:glutaredoxin-2 [[Candida] anglica]|uniref:Glutaredoxin-2 n=1 Tax=[Candida] anglica TaxID=148631 RepID=A0ABP0E6T8_9ASCO